MPVVLRASPVMQNERWSPLKSITCTGRHLPDLGELCKSSSLLSLHQPESRTGVGRKCRMVLMTNPAQRMSTREAIRFVVPLVR